MPLFNFEAFNISYPIQSNNTDFYENAYKIRLIKNTKDATSDWKDQDTKKWKQNYIQTIAKLILANYQRLKIKIFLSSDKMNLFNKPNLHFTTFSKMTIFTTTKIFFTI